VLSFFNSVIFSDSKNQLATCDQQLSILMMLKAELCCAANAANSRFHLQVSKKVSPQNITKNEETELPTPHRATFVRSIQTPSYKN
jgi:hypothetical protein